MGEKVDEEAPLKVGEVVAGALLQVRNIYKGARLWGMKEETSLRARYHSTSRPQPFYSSLLP